MTPSPRARTRTRGRATSERAIVGLAGALAFAATACGGVSQGAGVPSPVGGYGAATSENAVVQFLDAAQNEDYEGMWTVFGTAEGPAIERFGVQETEARMVVLSRLLKHRDYELRVANLAGLGPNRTRYEVRMEGTRKGSVMVPFVTAHDAGGRWYVEQLDADRLSGGNLN
ncbi:MAG TPA: hypothetical protein VLA33_06810 [Gemmatimonadota bacterium]|nr:hypothetical protein [Gemmatimonadota bacterium]